MQVFEIKTNKSDYPYIVIANGFKKAIKILYDKGIYDSNIVSVQQLETYKNDHILIEESWAEREHLKGELLYEIQKTLPKWRKMSSGVAGGTDKDIYLIRTSRGHYFTSACVGGDNYYLELESLEQLPGIEKKEK